MNRRIAPIKSHHLEVASHLGIVSVDSTHETKQL